jgi:hypothetical protein
MSVETTSKVATWGGSTAAVYGWFTVTEWCAIAGAIAALIGAVLQISNWLDRRADRRVRLELERLESADRRAVLAAQLRQFGERVEDRA